MRLPLYLRWSRSYRDGLRHHRKGEHDLAERDLLEAVRAARRMHPRDDRLGCSLHALARLRQLRGDLGAAGRLYRRALAAETDALGPQHPFTTEIARAYAGLLGQCARARALPAARSRPGRVVQPAVIAQP